MCTIKVGNNVGTNPYTHTIFRFSDAVIKSQCRWDEWAPASRLLKLNEENVAVQKALQAQASAANASQRLIKTQAGGGHKDGSASKTGRVRGRRWQRHKTRREECVPLLVIASVLCFGAMMTC